MPVTKQTKTLIEAALGARANARAMWSGFHVGAALLDAGGVITAGANVESASYGLTCCAERVALFKALTEGRDHFISIAVTAATPGGPTPCGACRQLLAEYAPGVTVHCVDASKPHEVRTFKIETLLPEAFTGSQLDASRRSRRKGGSS